MLAVGTLLSIVTDVVAVAVQPFPLVTVTVYIPALVIFTLAVVPKLFDHK